MSSAKKKTDERFESSYWNNFADKSKTFITAKQITMYIFIIAMSVQVIAQFITPSSWLNYQILAFIMATNLGAVLLAIHAQKSADDIREMYSAAFNGDFYHTLFLLSNFKNTIAAQGERDGKNLEEEMDELGVDSYGVIKGYLQAFNEQIEVEGPEEDIREIETEYTEDELFQTEGVNL